MRKKPRKHPRKKPIRGKQYIARNSVPEFEFLSALGRDGAEWNIYSVTRMPRGDAGKVGYADHREREIAVRLVGYKRYDLDTLLHECLHAEFPEFNEWAVRRATRHIMMIFSKAGFLKGWT